MLDKDLSLRYLYKLGDDLLENKPEWLFLLQNPLIIFLGDIQGTMVSARHKIKSDQPEINYEMSLIQICTVNGQLVSR